MDEIKTLHCNLVKAGEGARKIQYMAIAERGRLYNYLKSCENRNGSWEDFCTSLNVCRKTADRYITFSDVLEAYPRLLVCDVKFEEILRLYQKLNEYLLKDTDLLHRLKEPLRQIRLIGGGVFSSRRLPGADTKLDNIPQAVQDSDDDLDVGVLYRLQDELLS